ncbi:MAG: dienelactone hydrolase family protein [bacterium]|nr:dienelactone hydrolase family protein [bacterium]
MQAYVKIGVGILVVGGLVGASSFLIGSKAPSKDMMRNEIQSASKSPESSNSFMLKGQTGIAIKTDEPEYVAGVKGFFAMPQAPGAYPGVVMIHEWWGLNDNIRDMARELAKEGYAVLAVDLFGKVAANSDEARAQVGALDQTRALENLKAAAKYLKDGGAPKIASLGWCFGGGQSLQLALSGEDLAATIIYYGNLVTEEQKLSSIHWPVLGIFGDKDQSIPVSRVQEFDSALDKLGIANNIHVYPGVGHAFANPSGANWAPDETKDAWTKTLSFLSDNLKEADAPNPTIKQTSAAKEFTMTAFYEMIDDKPKPQFSLNEMRVKRGDAVRINITNTKGMHDFVIDEYGIQKETPLNKAVTVEFTADKAGSFVYYCSMPNHRALGQWGTLVVEG